MAASPLPDPSATVHEDLKYFYALNANVSNFVSVKLSGDSNYRLWKTQMLCLLESYNLHSILAATLIRPEIEKQYDSLVRGWIFGSVNERLLGTVVDLGSAIEVWEKLKSMYDPTMRSSEQDVVTEDPESDAISTKTKAECIEVVSVETETEEKDAISTVIETETQDKHTEIKIEDTKTQDKNNILRNKQLCKAILQGNWSEMESIIKEDRAAITEAISSDENTALHLAVGIGCNDIVRKILSLIEDVKLPKMTNLEGYTALHIAAIVGNTTGAELLVKKNRDLLETLDHKRETPLDKAYENMHIDTIEYLLKAANADGKTKKSSSHLRDSLNPGEEIGVNLLVNAISAKEYDLATKLVKKFPEFAVKNDNVLMAIAKTFPSGLDSGETLLYPNMDHTCKRVVKRTRESLQILALFFRMLMQFIRGIPKESVKHIVALVTFLILAPYIILVWIYSLILLLILVVHFPFFVLYFLLWKVATRVVPPIKHIEKKKKEWEEAKEVLKLVCDQIDNLVPPDAQPHYYTKPVLEAARQNAYEVVDEILMRSPGAIRYKDKSGYDIIQLAVIHRSEKVYNLIYIIGQRKSVYRTIEDSSKNNMLHLAGRLAPLQKLKCRTGAAFQLQRELQWREEVEKLVFPAYITKENIFMETPDTVFTREHEDLVKEGEKWMKAVAESCSITAALITTIVFAAAITVPGGSNQETGIPLFTEEIAFTIFAISDAISLFASSTALLMFLSILTGRFAEQDFLLSLPRRLIIGLCSLMVSTTVMMVAFGATLYLVFGRRRPWMLGPICVLAFLPIACFGTLQIPLIVDLYRSTYVRIFGKQSNNNSYRFNPNDILVFFGK